MATFSTPHIAWREREFGTSCPASLILLNSVLSLSAALSMSVSDSHAHSTAKVSNDRADATYTSSALSSSSS
eukprot:3892195-Rhodomonas_salina.3